jgi:hypothetical protein
MYMYMHMHMGIYMHTSGGVPEAVTLCQVCAHTHAKIEKNLNTRQNRNNLNMRNRASKQPR